MVVFSPSDLRKCNLHPDYVIKINLNSFLVNNKPNCDTLQKSGVTNKL